jgi:hypothetical protein
VIESVFIKNDHGRSNINDRHGEPFEKINLFSILSKERLEQRVNIVAGVRLCLPAAAAAEQLGAVVWRTSITDSPETS